MATGDWKNILKSQNDDIERLQAMDAELEQNNNISEIDKVINKKSSGLNVRTTSKANATNKNVPPIPEPNIDNEFSGDVPDYYDVYNDTEVDYYRSENVTPTSLNKRKGTIDNSVEKSFQSPMNAASRAPETENR